jgi:hypothetical protein
LCSWQGTGAWSQHCKLLTSSPGNVGTGMCVISANPVTILFKDEFFGCLLVLTCFCYWVTANRSLFHRMKQLIIILFWADDKSSLSPTLIAFPHKIYEIYEAREEYLNEGLGFRV